jgi:sugar lactone lactonase YvrE
MIQLSASLAIASGDRIGESPFWDASAERLIWCDQEQGLVSEARADGAAWRLTEQWRIGRHVGAVAPRANGGLLVASGLEVLALGDDGGVSVLARVDTACDGLVINEAKCDPAGRLWLGVMSMDFSPGAGALYCLEAHGQIRRMLDGVTIANGMGWSGDGRTMYFADSAARGVDAFDFDAASGKISGRRRFLTCSAGCPDGLTIDAEDCVWVAIVGKGVVERISPEGRMLAEISVPTPAVTSCAFGAAAADTLFITTLGRPIPEVATQFGCTHDEIRRSTQSLGHVFACKPGVRGNAATPFAASP